jgi:predicted DNA-binding protein (MmcQ/YjbR family)
LVERPPAPRKDRESELRERTVIVKCDPQLVEILRGKFTGVGHRSHLDRRYWISASLDVDVSPGEIETSAGEFYALVCANLTRKQMAELAVLPDGAK